MALKSDKKSLKDDVNWTDNKTCIHHRYFLQHNSPDCVKVKHHLCPPDPIFGKNKPAAAGFTQYLSVVCCSYFPCAFMMGVSAAVSIIFMPKATFTLMSLQNIWPSSILFHSHQCFVTNTPRGSVHFYKAPHCHSVANDKVNDKADNVNLLVNWFVYTCSSFWNNITIHLESCFWPPDESKSIIYSLVTPVRSWPKPLHDENIWLFIS